MHIKEFNKSWDYFDGMSEHDIECFIKSDQTWHRSTQKFDSPDNFFNILWNNAINDNFNLFEKFVNQFNDLNYIKISKKLVIIGNGAQKCKKVLISGKIFYPDEPLFPSSKFMCKKSEENFKKENFEEICDLRQPVILNYHIDELINNCNKDVVTQQYGGLS